MNAVDITRLQDSIDALAQAFAQAAGRTSGAASAVTGSLRSAAQSFAGVRTAADEVAAVQDRLAKRSLAYEAAIEQTVSTIKSLATGAVNATQALYSASGAFSAAATGTNTFFTTLAQATDIVSGLAGTIPRVGTALEILGKTAGFALNLYNQALNFQLQAMQTQVDTYMNLSRQGATFGGSLFYLQNAVAMSGVPLREYAALVSSSAEDLSRMGLSLTGATQAVIGFTNRQLMTNRELVGLYGNFQELAQGTAQYLALQTQLGVVDTSNQAKQTQGTTEYLRRQKELSDLLGKNTKTLADEESRRRQNLAYSSELSRVMQTNASAGNNIQRVTGLFQKMSPALGNMAEQAFVGENALSQQSMRLREFFPVLAGVQKQLIDASKTMSEEDFNRFMAGLLEANKSAIEQESRSFNTQFGQIFYQVQGPLREVLDTAQGTISQLNQLSTAAKILVRPPPPGETPAEQAEAARRADALNNILQTAENKRLELQRNLDLNIASRFQEMVKLVEIGFKVQELQIAATNAVLTVGNATFNAAYDAFMGRPVVGDEALAAAEAAARTQPAAAATPAAPAAAPARRPQPPRPEAPAGGAAGSAIVPGQQTSSLTSTPKIELDLNPVVVAIGELKRSMDDSRSIQERMLYSLA